jgi:hypothetical protein
MNGVRQPSLNDWPLASGDIINSTACAFPVWPSVPGKFEISGLNSGVTIDFCNTADPIRTIH